MIYQSYQAQADGIAPVRAAAAAARGLLVAPLMGFELPWSRMAAAVLELVARAGLSHRRPSFDISSVRVGNADISVTEEALATTPFCTLVHFKKQPVDRAQPRVLLVAPMSGHFATLLRDTVRTMLPDHDIYLTDWHNARDVPRRQGRFGFDDFIGHLIHFLEIIGEGGHILAVCQPCVAALAAVAVMAEEGNPAQPRSMTLMAGPIDTRVNPTKVNEFALNHSIDWFEHNLVAVVPHGHAGAMRRVYPGFVQLLAFMAMNPGRHVKAFRDTYHHFIAGEYDKAQAVLAFYEEYFAVMDLPAEFYLETVARVFQMHELPRGILRWQGRRVDPGAVRRTMLLTVEGDRDDICAVGQTLAAQDLCSRLQPWRKRHHVQPGVGHYGVFSGRRWNSQIYPLVRDHIHESE